MTWLVELCLFNGLYTGFRDISVRDAQWLPMAMMRANPEIISMCGKARLADRDREQEEGNEYSDHRGD